jgi:hypothetical protein
MMCQHCLEVMAKCLSGTHCRRWQPGPCTESLIKDSFWLLGLTHVRKTQALQSLTDYRDRLAST